MDKLGILLNDANELLDSRSDIESDREAILSAMIVDKLGVASQRVEECDDLAIEVNYQDVDLKALSNVRSYINLLDSMISYNNDTYNRVLKFSLEQL